jgi:hypothetical protein
MTVVTKQGDLELLNDPLAQELLQSRIHARLSYMWPDGTPRVVPINFHWTGEELVLGTPPRAPKVMALQQNPKVAITIDTDDFPHKVLLIRGTSTLDVMDRVVPEYAEAARRYMGDEAAAGWLEQIDSLLPQMGGMVRVGIRPEWVGIIDFSQRWPSAVEKAMAAAQSQRQ